MIKGVHTMFYTSQAKELREFLRDKGWLVFNLFYCDDIQATVKELKAKGEEFPTGIEDRGYGLAAYFKMPGEFDAELYEPSYKKSK